MPTYKAEGKGKTVEFDWNDPNPPTEADLEEIFAQAEQWKPEQQAVPEESSWKKAVSTVGRPTLEMGGLTAGSVLGGAATAPTVVGAPAGAAAGGALGYGIGKKLADVLDAALGYEIPSLEQGVKEVPSLLATGAVMEAGGQTAAKAAGLGLKGAWTVGKQVLGKLTGAGKGAFEEAAIAGPEFRKAMRGRIPGEEIVENAKNAVVVLKDARGAAYRRQLAEISKNKTTIDMRPIRSKLQDLMKHYNVLKDPKTGKLDTSRMAVDPKARKDVVEIIKTVSGWNRQGDNTAVGLDTLKRQLDDFYSESSQAKAFVQSLRDTVKNTIVKNVPEYAQMTKGYAEATQLIKDIEAGLMTRKQGMTGRIVADQTLRRLMSAMRESSELRKELLDLLTESSGRELSQQVAGYTLKGLMPVGLAGTAPSIAGMTALAKFVSPAFWPALMMSSPRVAGEFVQFIGRASRGTMSEMGPAVRRGMAYTLAKPPEEQPVY